MIISQQDFFYDHFPGGIEMDPEIYLRFRKATLTMQFVSDADIETMKTLSINSINQLQDDYDADL